MNAVKGEENRQKAKDISWQKFPQAYEDLMQCGMSEWIILEQPQPYDTERVLRSRNIVFNIGHLGQKVLP